MPLPTGYRLDWYEIGALIGAGGMGEVYRARDTSLKRDVAIKVMPSNWSRDSNRLRRFELEAQAAAALNHPNIVSIFHVGRADGAPYIVTELLHGESLRERLKRGPLKTREALDMCIQMTRGLASAHNAGIIHRDLKPENLFLLKDKRLKILDFGLARLEPAKDASDDGVTVTSHPASHGPIFGTVGYMSPEQVRGQKADARSDLFAVGVILYESLTGERPFRKATSAETMTAILNEDPFHVSHVGMEMSPGVQKIVNRCLSKNPEHRFQNASDLAFALEAVSDTSSAALPDLAKLPPKAPPVWIGMCCLVAAFLSALIVWFREPPAVPRVEAVTQLTYDGQRKSWPLLTDGSRIYFNVGSASLLRIAQIAVSGGPSASISTSIPIPQISALAPEGSALLVMGGASNATTHPLWQVALPTGEPRRVGDVDVSGGGYAPDGRILYARGHDLYLAEGDGSNPRRIVTLDKGRIEEPIISPDGTRIAFTRFTNDVPHAVVFLANLDGSELHPLITGFDPAWSPDGKHLIVSRPRDRFADLWAVSMTKNWFTRAPDAVQLTYGPLSYIAPAVSRDGKQIFAIGIIDRGELVRYDSVSHEFLPFLSGLSAWCPTFSRDGQWVAYVSDPDQTLWRSRADGSARAQLTYPPSKVLFPFISPDGRQVVYSTRDSGSYLVSMQGGLPHRIGEPHTCCPNWSADGSALIFTGYDNDGHSKLEVLDLQSGTTSVVPGSRDHSGAMFLLGDKLVANLQNHSRPPNVQNQLELFDLNTKRWLGPLSDPQLGPLVNWTYSPDHRNLYYTTGGPDAKAVRVRLEDRKSEIVAGIDDSLLATDSNGHTGFSVAPDGSPVLTRDIGTHEIYALSVKWP